MEVTRILAEIDAQIGKLQQARTILSGVASPIEVKKSVGRPRKAIGTAVVPKQMATDRKKRNLSPEARKRIADAQKRRWAERRKAA
ncbi:MAG: hypothetical protein ACRYF4_13665 [Janthinobacterium lividum]